MSSSADGIVESSLRVGLTCEFRALPVLRGGMLVIMSVSRSFTAERVTFQPAYLKLWKSGNCHAVWS